MHRDYLQEHNPIRFDDLVLEGKLWTYLADLNEQAKNRLQLIIRKTQIIQKLVGLRIILSVKILLTKLVQLVVMQKMQFFLS